MWSFPVWRAAFLLGAAAFTAGPASAAQGYKLSAELALTPDAGDVTHFQLSPDGVWVVYRVDQNEDELFELYARRTDKSQPAVRLNGSLPHGGDVGAFHVAGRVVFQADALSDNVVELFSVPIDASAPPVRLSAPLPMGWDVVVSELTPDGARALYRIRDGVGNERIFSVPVDASESPLELGAGLGSCEAHRLSPDGRYVAMLLLGGGRKLWIQPVDASAPALELAVVSIGYVISGGIEPTLALRFTPNGQRILFRELFMCGFDSICSRIRSVPANGSAPAILLPDGDVSGPFFQDGARMLAANVGLQIVSLVGGPSVPLYQPAPNEFVRVAVLSPDETTAVFGTAVASTSILALYRVPVDGSQAATPIAGPWSGVQALKFTPDSATLLVSDGNPDSESSLYAVALAGGAARTLLSTSFRGLPELRLLPGADEVVFRANVVLVGFGPDFPELYRRPLDANVPALRLDDPPGGVLDFELSSDEQDVFFLAQAGDGPAQLASVPIDASAAPQVYNGPLPGGPPILGDVTHFLVTDAGDVAVYRADAEQNERFELFAARPFDRRGPLRLNPPLQASDDVAVEFALSKDGERAAFWTGAGSFHDLWCVRTDGSAPPARLASVLLVTTSPSPLRFTPEGDRLLFRPGDSQLASVRTDASEEPVVFGPFGAFVRDFQLSKNGRRVLFACEGARDELFSAPVDGSRPPARLVPDGSPTQDILSLEVRGNGLVFYRSDPVENVFDLFVVGLNGGEPPRRLNPPLGPGSDVTDYAVSQDGTTIVYRADLAADERFELFRALPLEHAQPLTPLSASADVESDFVLDARGNVHYRADALQDERIELWRVPADGSASPVQVSAPFLFTTDVLHFQVSPDAAQVLFAVGNFASPASFNLYRAVPGGGLGGLLAGAVRSYGITPDSRSAVYATQSTFHPSQLLAAPFSGGPAEVLESTPVLGQDAGRILSFQLRRGGRAFYLAEGETFDVRELFLAFVGRSRREASDPRPPR